MQYEEKLKNLKRKILEKKKNKSESLLFELRELNQSFNELKEILYESKDISEIKENLDYVKIFEDLDNKLGTLTETVNNLDFSKLPKPNVIIPSKIDVNNIKDARPEKVNIDWENRPKDRDESKNILSMLSKSLSKTIDPVLNILTSMSMKITEYISEPDRVVITDSKIEEYYGNRKVTYRINDDGRKMEVTREV